jgi:hypothetical protein
MFFFFILYAFSFTKLENGRAEQVLPGGEIGTGGRGEVARKGGRRIDSVQIMYTHVCKCKSDICCNCSRNWERGMKEWWWWGEFKYDIFDTL